MRSALLRAVESALSANNSSGAGVPACSRARTPREPAARPARARRAPRRRPRFRTSDVAVKEDAARLQILREARGALGAGDAEFQHLIGFDHGLIHHPRDHQAEEQRSEQRSEQQRGEQRAPVAEILLDLLGKHGQQRAHQTSSASSPSTFRNASSSEAAPRRERRASGVPSASTRPRPMMITRSHRAATSCITCDENRMQRPAAFRSASIQRRLRIAITSRPLVGSSRTRFCGPCTSARRSATLMRWPCEKPSARRSMKARSCRAAAASCVGARLNTRAAPTPCSAPK